MSVLAWLMLVVNTLSATPLGMLDGAHLQAMPGMQMSVASVDGHDHHGVSVASSCDPSVTSQHHDGCGGRTVHHCSCDAMCGNVLTPTPLRVVPTVAMRSAYGRPLRIHAPSLDTAPPLRPPTV